MLVEMDLVDCSYKVVIQTMKVDFLEPPLLHRCRQYGGNELNIYAKVFMGYILI